jgi:ribosomal protein S21
MKPTLVSVEVRNGDINKALKVFKSKVLKSGHIEELKDRREYLKPSVKKRLLKEKAKRDNERMVLIQKLLNK